MHILVTNKKTHTGVAETLLLADAHSKIHNGTIEEQLSKEGLLPTPQLALTLQPTTTSYTTPTIAMLQIVVNPLRTNRALLQEETCKETNSTEVEETTIITINFTTSKSIILDNIDYFESTTFLQVGFYKFDEGLRTH